ncbi:hypothetical protein PINS_up004479 [Pythium insidiosum]|nr:hypothetical protein PINS_up004479 [Pythium insidiosum]
MPLTTIQELSPPSPSLKQTPTRASPTKTDDDDDDAMHVALLRLVDHNAARLIAHAAAATSGSASASSHHSKDDDDVVVYRPQDTRQRRRARVAARSHLFAPLQDVQQLLDPRVNPASDRVLHPSLHADPEVPLQSRTLGVILDFADEWLTIQHVTPLHARRGRRRRRQAEHARTPRLSRPRDFVLLEHQRAVLCADGRRGWLVSFHSVAWAKCPPPAVDDVTVRGSLYCSGIVVLESATLAGRLDVVVVAELNAKGDTSEQLNRWLSERRAVNVLSALTRGVERFTARRLSLMTSGVFEMVHRRRDDLMTTMTSIHDDDTDRCCVTCCLTITEEPLAAPPLRCRKCADSVCADCSILWRTGKKEIRLCMECWADATLNRCVDDGCSSSARGHPDDAWQGIT